MCVLKNQIPVLTKTIIVRTAKDSDQVFHIHNPCVLVLFYVINSILLLPRTTDR